MKAIKGKHIISALIAVALLISYISIMPTLVHSMEVDKFILGNLSITQPEEGKYTYGTTDVNGTVNITEENADTWPDSGINWALSFSGSEYTLNLYNATISTKSYHLYNSSLHNVNDDSGYSAIYNSNYKINIGLSGTNTINANYTTDNSTCSGYSAISATQITIEALTAQSALIINSNVDNSNGHDIYGIRTCNGENSPLCIKNCYIEINNLNDNSKISYIDTKSGKDNLSFSKIVTTGKSSDLLDTSIDTTSDDFVVDFIGDSNSKILTSDDPTIMKTHTDSTDNYILEKGNLPSHFGPQTPNNKEHVNNNPTSNTTSTTNTDSTPSISNTDKVVEAIADVKKGDTLKVNGDSSKPIEKEIIKSMKDTGMILQIDYDDYTWFIDGSTITDTDKDIDLAVTKSTVTTANDIIKFNINYDGDLPFEAKLKIDVPGYIKEGTELYLYKVDGDKRIYQSSAISQGYSATFQRNSCSDYVISLVKPDEISAGEAATENVISLN